MKIGGVILAGGASRRMGTAKALLTFEGETFLDRLTGIFAHHCQQVIAVLGHEDAKIRAGLARSPEFVVNPDPERGQVSSLQCGFRALAPSTEAVLFTPVDFPSIRPGTVATLCSAGLSSAVVPEYRGRHGHPVLVSAQLIREFLELGPDGTARDVMHRHIAETRYLDVDDPGILLDVDDPEAYVALTQAAL